MLAPVLPHRSDMTRAPGRLESCQLAGKSGTSSKKLEAAWGGVGSSQRIHPDPPTPGKAAGGSAVAMPSANPATEPCPMERPKECVQKPLAELAEVIRVALQVGKPPHETVAAAVQCRVTQRWLLVGSQVCGLPQNLRHPTT